MATELFAKVRQERGLAISQSKKIAKITDRLWAVPSQTHGGKWVVDSEAGTCMCPDYETNHKTCKHQYAVLYARHQITHSDGTTVVTETVKITYGQNWPAYNAGQRMEKPTVRRLLKDLCSAIPQPQYKGNGRPHLPWSDVLYGVCMKVYSGDSARRADGDIGDCKTLGFMDVAPAPNTILRYLNKPEVTPILRSLIEESAKPLAAVEDKFAVDSTGFSTCTYARYFDHKHGKDKRVQKWITAHTMIGVRTNIITSIYVTPNRAGDAPQLPGLLNATAKRFPEIREVSADKAYLSNANLTAIEAVGGVPYVPFKENSTVAGGGDAWKRMWHFFNLEKDAWLANYHRRSNVEATYKRKLGFAVRAKNEQAQVNEVLVKCLLFNLTVLGHEIQELGIDPKFWQPGGQEAAE
jgi:transposase